MMSAPTLLARLRTLPGAAIQHTEPEIILIRSGAKQIGRLRNLGFGHFVRPPTYRSAPTHRRSGACDSPFYYCYFDPYQDLLHWVIVEDMLANRAGPDARVRVVAGTTDMLFSGSDAAAHADHGFEVPRSAVHIGPNGLRSRRSSPM